MSNTQNLGTFVYDDEASSVVVTVRNPDGTLYNFTGAGSVELPWKKLGGDESGTITGSIYGTATNGQLLFEGLAQAVAQPASGARNTYRAIPRWKNSGDTKYSNSKIELRYSVERFP